MAPKGATAACCLFFACFFSDVLSAVRADGANGKRQNLLLDVDTGVDDAMAITLAASSPNVCVLAITVVAGNTNLSNAYNNTLRVLQAINRTDIPVYKGADRPIDGRWDYEEIYFGPDNFGNASSLYPMGNNSAPDPNTYGYLKMIEVIKNSSNDLTLVLLGPLTNLAIALLVEPNLTENVTAIYILGGNIYGRGNILPGSEFNFLTDPEAALVVLQRALCPVYSRPDF
uniref:Putative inosine-uridine preferring nucleoside hydrolase n=1 Tax=Amblyomma cajennense TaxID=34607 RepID=A0A023FDF8_AMBCJ